jgi:GT2 family glycosyltransferase
MTISDPAEAASVTTVVISRNRKEELRASLARHQGPVVLVDNGSADGTAEMVARDHPGVELVALPANAGARARNLGVERARTPYVAFADDDSWWAPGALPAAQRILDRHPRIGLLAGRILLRAEQVEDPLCAVMALSPLPGDDEVPGRPILGFAACGAVVRREAFLAVGGFDQVVFFAGEEARVALDLAAEGWAMRYVPELVAHHHPSVQRRRTGRTALIARNAILTAVMRRPWPVVLKQAKAALTAPGGAGAVTSALPRIPAALQTRRRVPEVEAQLRLLERWQPTLERELDLRPPTPRSSSPTAVLAGGPSGMSRRRA